MSKKTDKDFNRELLKIAARIESLSVRIADLEREQEARLLVERAREDERIAQAIRSEGLFRATEFLAVTGEEQDNLKTIDIVNMADAFAVFIAVGRPDVPEPGVQRNEEGLRAAFEAAEADTERAANAVKVPDGRRPRINPKDGDLDAINEALNPDVVGGPTHVRTFPGTSPEDGKR